ncbi:hypothetical protein AKJ16_DCAP11494 [Drosera capensis]
MTYLRSSVEVGETDELLKNKEGMNGLQEHGYHDKAIRWAGYLGNMMHITYLTCAGAVLMTDIVFWCVLVPTQAGIELNLVSGIDFVSRSMLRDLRSYNERESISVLEIVPQCVCQILNPNSMDEENLGQQTRGRLRRWKIEANDHNRKSWLLTKGNQSR